jgi:hypothetical protein
MVELAILLPSEHEMPVISFVLVSPAGDKCNMNAAKTAVQFPVRIFTINGNFGRNRKESRVYRKNTDKMKEKRQRANPPRGIRLSPADANLFHDSKRRG